MADATTKELLGRLPPVVELRDIGLSFTLPRGKNLSRTWSRELRTELASRVRLRITQEALTLRCDPPIVIDALWPAKNMLFGGADVRFEDARIEAWVSPIDGPGEGLVDFTADAKKQIVELLAAGLRGTKMAQPGYDPMQDEAALATLEAIADNFRKTPSTGTSDVSAADLGDPAIEATLALRERFVHEQGGAGLEVEAGGSIHVEIKGSGDLASIAAEASNEARVRAANLQSITITSEAVTVVHGGAPLVELVEIRVDRGGGVALSRMRLRGALEEVSGLESLVRVVAGVVRFAGSEVPLDPGLALAAAGPASEATLVPGLVRRKIEDVLAEGVRKLVREHASSIPGLDLRDVLAV
ncbi:hypothetical protein [Polyangium spumosum]|uniref:Uncharacterized protein n=1 Tax=Polyangium spumosum TaxID=889282 RepID=A0A6N7PY40_9BACT|nr:hypothetical protein [Polyangium spumosum]MRG95380.1 hypothetical protein [Polyangium spumosum]